MLKLMPLIGSLFLTTSVFAGTLSVTDDIIACVRKPRNGYVTSWSLVMLKKTQGIVVYQNSSGGNESDPITGIGQVGSKLVVQHQLGTKETVTFDLNYGTATWVEDSYPTNTEVYKLCASFAKYDFDDIQRWFNSHVESPEWATRQEY